MKGTSLVFLILLMTSCKTRSWETHTNVSLNVPVLEKIKSESGHYILFSCLNCTCFNQVIRDLKTTDKNFLSGLNFVADTHCIKTDIQLTPVRQSFIDSISIDMYNLTLVKKEKDHYVARIVKTGECERLIPICREFFGSEH